MKQLHTFLYKDNRSQTGVSQEVKLKSRPRGAQGLPTVTLPSARCRLAGSSNSLTEEPENAVQKVAYRVLASSGGHNYVISGDWEPVCLSKACFMAAPASGDF